MGVQPSDFKNHSEKVSNEFGSEIAYRCAISRGYYYAFHFVKQHGKQRPEVTFQDGRGDHGIAMKFLRKIGGNDLADDLDDLHRMRKNADYDIDDNIDDMDYAIFQSELEDLIIEVKQQL